MARSFPPSPNLEYDKKQAKRLLRAIRSGDALALARVYAHHPRYQSGTPHNTLHREFSLADAQLVIAREYGFASWSHYQGAMKSMIDKTTFDRAIDAVINGDTSALKQLLSNHPELSTARAPDGRGHATLLHYVSANGVDDHHQKTPQNAVEVAEILLKAGADPNATAGFYGGGGGSTPLVCLVSSAHPHRAGVQSDLVRVYVAHGARLDGIDNDSRPLATALDHWYPAAFETLVALGARRDNLVTAAAAGEIDQVQAMLQTEILQPYIDANGARVSDPTTIKALAFVKACLCGQLDTVAALIAAGVDVNARVKYNRTGLHEAAWTGQTHVIDYLLANGADPGLIDDQFMSMPVQWAYFAGQYAAYEQLVPVSPLTLATAAQFGLLDRVRALLADNSAAINTDNGAALRAAVSYKHIDIVRLLLEHGADQTLKNDNGDSALDIARRIGNQEVIALLEAY